MPNPNEILDRVEDEEIRVHKALLSIDPLDRRYAELARIWLDSVMFLNAMSSATPIKGCEPFDPAPGNESFVEEPVAINEAVKKSPAPKKKSYTLEEVRDLFQTAAESIRIQPIVKRFVEEGSPSKLSSVKPERYAELVEALQEALKENAQ